MNNNEDDAEVQSDDDEPPEDTTAPTLTLVEDSQNNTVAATGSTVQVSSELMLTFSEAMESRSITATTLTLLCGGTNIEGTTSVLVSGNSSETNPTMFGFIPNADLPTLQACTLTLRGGTGGITDLAGNPLVGDVSYTFTAGCLSSDDFENSSSLVQCYTVINSSNLENDFGSSPSAQIGLQDGQLRFAMTTVNSDTFNNIDGSFFLGTLPGLAKTVSGNFDIQITATTITVPLELPGDDGGVGLMVIPSLTEEINDFVTVGIGSTSCNFQVFSNGTPSDAGSDGACASGVPTGNSYYADIDLRLIRSGSNFYGYRRLSGETDFTQIGITTSIPSMPTEVYLVIGATKAGTDGTEVFLLDDLLFSGGRAVGQD